MMKKKLKLRSEAVRTLANGELRDIRGAWQASNLTCQGGCCSIGCWTHHVSEVEGCTV